MSDFLTDYQCTQMGRSELLVVIMALHISCRPQTGNHQFNHSLHPLVERCMCIYW